MHSSRVVDSGVDSKVAAFLVVLEDVSRLILRNRAARCPVSPVAAVLAAVSQ